MAPTTAGYLSSFLFSYLKNGLSQLQVMAGPPIRSFVESEPDLLLLLFYITLFSISLLVLISTVKAIFRMIYTLVRLMFFVTLVLIVLRFYFRGIDGIQSDIEYLVSTGQHYDVYGGEFSEKLQQAVKDKFGNSIHDNINSFLANTGI